MSKPIYKSEISRRVQRVVADILVQFLMCEDEDDAIEVIKKISDDYMLEVDPFTGLPCSIYDYQRLLHAYEKQVMIEKFGHCDGLEE